MMLILGSDRMCFRDLCQLLCLVCFCSMRCDAVAGPVNATMPVAELFSQVTSVRDCRRGSAAGVRTSLIALVRGLIMVYYGAKGVPTAA